VPCSDASYLSIALTLILQILREIALDSHYKYFALLIIPTMSYFVIANWVGWQYFSNT
jgi:hypothetical protein